MYKFKGKDGEFLMGIPARDLSDDEFAALSDAQKNFLKAHLKTDDPLYEKVADKEDAKDEKASSKK